MMTMSVPFGLTAGYDPQQTLDCMGPTATWL
jgi:hypothetical protein